MINIKLQYLKHHFLEVVVYCRERFFKSYVLG